MYILWSLACILLVFEPTFGGHFYGGTIRWIPVNKNATTSPVQIIITQTYTYTLSLVNCSVGSLINLRNAYGFNFSLWCTLNCGATSAGYYAPPVLSYCTGSNSALNIAFAQRTDIVNLTANDYFSISNGVPNTTIYGNYRALSLSTGGNDTLAQWNITTAIDIRPRSDNGLINTPPVANLMSPYAIPYNVSTKIAIRTVDIDGDDVRCRWGTSPLECGDVCFPRTIPPSATLSSDCILTITGLKINDWYCAPMQVEDFLDKNTSTPLSSVPVQFLIYVYQPKNCSIPLLSSPLSCIGVQVGIPYTFTYTAINQCGSSSNISGIVLQTFTGIVEGPLVQITPNPNTAIYAMNVTYTPLLSQVGLQAICATALDNNKIPSDQYCITFIVGSTTVPLCPANITTTTTFITTTAESIVSKPNPTNWALIGTIAGLMTLFTLFCCYCCYHCLWGAAARRRRHRKQKPGQTRRSQLINEGIDKLRRISRPRTAYQTHNIDTERTDSVVNVIKDQQTKSPSSTNNAKKETESDIISYRSSHNLLSSTKNDPKNPTKNVIKVIRLPSNKERQPNIARISPYEPPKETENNILSHRRPRRSTLPIQNDLKRSLEKKVKIIHISSNNNRSTTKNEMKHDRKTNSVSVTRIINTK